MEDTTSLGFACLNLLPVLFFLVGGYHLAKLAVITLKDSLSRVFISGVSLIFLGGATKAAWKLLYAAKIADVQWVSELQFVFMALGYLGTLIPLLTLVRSENQDKTLPVYSIALWKIPFLIIMTLACLGSYAALAVIAFRRHLRLSAAGFIVALTGVSLMGFLASQPQTLSLQWIELGINSGTNISFAISSYWLLRNYS